MNKFNIAKPFLVCSFFLSVNVCLAQTDPLYIDPSGKVGIGTNIPSSTLDVKGVIKSAALDVNGVIKSNALEVNGAIKATALDVSGRVKDQTGYLMPVGSIIAYGGSTVPEGWLLCDGQAMAGDQKYNDLRQVIGNNTPDLRSRFIVGTGQGPGLSNYNRNDKSGQEKVVLTVNEMPTHKHYGFGEFFNDNRWPFGTQGPSNQRGSRGNLDDDNTFYGTTDAGGNQPHENRPPYYALTYIIKY
ncbi:MAG: phage tail protein [Sphingobacteriaceae bacterium]